MVQRSARLDLAPVSTSVGMARRFVREQLLGWELDELVDPAVLLTSEVTTNAVLHARTPYAVVLAVVGEAVVVDVLDGSTVRPQQRKRTATAATGRGVAMVAQLAQQWGLTPAAGLRGFAKGVRFSLPVGGVAEDAWGAQDWLEGL